MIICLFSDAVRRPTIWLSFNLHVRPADASRAYPPLNKQPPPNQHLLVIWGSNQSTKVAWSAQQEARIYVYFYWTSEDCHGQAILTLHLSVGQVILFPYFDHCPCHLSLHLLWITSPIAPTSRPASSRFGLSFSHWNTAHPTQHPHLCPFHLWIQVCSHGPCLTPIHTTSN